MPATEQTTSATIWYFFISQTSILYCILFFTYLQNSIIYWFFPVQVRRASFRFYCLAHCCDCLYGEYWFRLFRYVYDGNRSFAAYTKTKSVESAVWCLLTRDDDVEQRVADYFFCFTGNGIEIPEHGSGSELFFFFCTLNKQRINENENTTNDQAMNKINEQLITNKEHK